MKKQSKRMTAMATRLGLALMLTTLVLGVAFAQTVSQTYGWEDGGTILGSYGNLVNPLNVASGTDPNVMGSVTPYMGSAMLQVTESPHASTPEAWIAFIENLSDGDVVNASFWGWDSTPGAGPSLRIWAHYAISGDPSSDVASAGGNSTYTDAAGAWSQVSHSWTFDSDGGNRDALMIQARLYSTPSTADPASTDFWIDDVFVEAPDTATIRFPNPTGIELASFDANADGGRILLEWETFSEVNNLGFNLYRAGSTSSPRTKLNANLILAQNATGLTGARYQFADETAAPGVAYYYWLEDVDLGGEATLHGPVEARLDALRRLLPARPRLAPLAPVLRHK